MPLKLKGGSLQYMFVAVCHIQCSDRKPGSLFCHTDAKSFSGSFYYIRLQRLTYFHPCSQCKHIPMNPRLIIVIVEEQNSYFRLQILGFRGAITTVSKATASNTHI